MAYAKTTSGLLFNSSGITIVRDDTSRVTGTCPWDILTTANEQFGFLVSTTALTKTSAYVTRVKAKATSGKGLFKFDNTQLDVASRPSTGLTYGVPDSQENFHFGYCAADPQQYGYDYWGGAAMFGPTAYVSNAYYVYDTEHRVSNGRDYLTYRGSDLSVLGTGNTTYALTNNPFIAAGDVYSSHTYVTMTVDHMIAMTSFTATVTDIETGYTVKLYNASDTELASGNESGGQVALDLSGLAIGDAGITGYFKVFNGVTLVRRVPISGTVTAIYGGDTWPGVNPAAPAPTTITPASAAPGAVVNVTNLAGTGFSGATVKLTKTGQSDINATSVVVESSTKITCTFDLTGAATGFWNVVVTNDDTQSGTITNGFEVKTSGNPVQSRHRRLIAGGLK